MPIIRATNYAAIAAALRQILVDRRPTLTRDEFFAISDAACALDTFADHPPAPKTPPTQ